MRLRLAVDGETRDIEVERIGAQLVVRIEGAVYRVRARPLLNSVQVRIGETIYDVQLRGAEALLNDGPHRFHVEDIVDEAAAESEGPQPGRPSIFEVRPPMPGRVVRIAVARGDRVRKGQTLLVLEAMKMQNEIPSPGNGIVRDVRVSEGESISADRVVASVEIPGS